MPAAKRIFVFYLFIILFPLYAGNKEEPYLVKTKDFHVKSFSLSEIDLGITAVIYNPYKAKAKIDEVLIDVFVQDKKLGTILEATDVVEIPRQSAFDLPLELRVKTGPTLAKFATETARLALGKTVQVDYKGYVKVRAVGFIPVKVKIDQTEFFTYKDVFPSKEKAKDTLYQKEPKPVKAPVKQN